MCVCVCVCVCVLFVPTRVVTNIIQDWSSDMPATQRRIWRWMPGRLLYSWVWMSRYLKGVESCANEMIRRENCSPHLCTSPRPAPVSLANTFTSPLAHRQSADEGIMPCISPLPIWKCRCFVTGHTPTHSLTLFCSLSLQYTAGYWNRFIRSQYVSSLTQLAWSALYNPSQRPPLVYSHFSWG